MDLATSATAERIYTIIHSDIDAIMDCNWYRPPDAPLSHLQSFNAEFEQHSQGCVAHIICGDLNVHHQRWLIHSSKNSAEGEILQQISTDYNLCQLVRQPTRGNYLLDLILTDLSDTKITAFSNNYRSSGSFYELPDCHT